MGHSVKAILMRGGIAKGVFFLEEDLPKDSARRDQFLLSAFSAPLLGQNDGIGSGTLTSNRIAILRSSKNKESEVDFLFGQILPDENRIDFSSNCGNMLAAAGPFSVESGLVRPDSNAKNVKITINNLNTRSLVYSNFPILNGRVIYEGDFKIDGVTRTYSPVELDFGNAIGLATGRMFPTGNRSENIRGLCVTCIDAAMPIVTIHAEALGISGYETKQQIDDNALLRKELSEVRMEAGKRMGLGDVSEKSIPKICIFSSPVAGGNVCARYIDPVFCHPHFGITAGLALATAAKISGTNVSYLLKNLHNSKVFVIEHPGGQMALVLEIREQNGQFLLTKAASITTAKKIMDGMLYE